QDIPKESSHLSNKIIANSNNIKDDDEISLKRKNPEDSSVTPTNNSSDNKLVDPTSKCKRKRSNSTQIESTSANNDLKKQRTRRSTRIKTTNELSEDGSMDKLSEDEPMDETSEDGLIDELSEDGPMDELSEDGPMDELSEDEPVDEASEDGPIDEVSEYRLMAQ
ncbi:hypothetical protein RhiirA4_486833, partial [Rhizophagus irregularis]